MKEESESFACMCSTPAHEFKFVADLDQAEPIESRCPVMYLISFLATGNFLWRLKRAAKYLLVYHQNFGHFEESVLGVAEVRRIREMCDRFLSAAEEVEMRRTKWNSES